MIEQLSQIHVMFLEPGPLSANGIKKGGHTTLKQLTYKASPGGPPSTSLLPPASRGHVLSSVGLHRGLTFAPVAQRGWFACSTPH
jgi:hypothetical protein